MTLISGPLDPAGAAACFIGPEYPAASRDCGVCDLCDQPAVIVVSSVPPGRFCPAHGDEFNAWLVSAAIVHTTSRTFAGQTFIWPPGVRTELDRHAPRHADTTPPA